MIKNWKYNPPVALNRLLLGRKVVHKDYTQTGSVASGGSETVTVTAPDGKIWFLKTLEIRVMPDLDATSGNHDAFLKVNPNDVGMLYGESTYDTAVHFEFGNWISANSLARPPDNTVPQKVVTSILIDDTDGITFRYRNRTDVAQENNREYYLDVFEVTVS